MDHRPTPVTPRPALVPGIPQLRFRLLRTTLDNLKINFRTNRGTSEGPETSGEEYLTR